MPTTAQHVHPYTTTNYSNIQTNGVPMHALYRFFDETRKLLYVGETNDPGKRFEQHRKRGVGPWSQVASITIDWFESREVARAAERAAIRTEKPTWNTVHNARMWYPQGTIIGIAVVKYRKPIAYVGTVLDQDKKTLTLRLLGGPGGNEKVVKLGDIKSHRVGSIEDVRAFKRYWEES